MKTKTDNIYYEEDLQRFEPVIIRAKEIWKDRCEKFIKERGDRGTCVIGAGLYVNYLPSRRHRKSIKKTIIKASEVCNAQCSQVWEESMYDVMDFLVAHDIRAYYEPGVMD